MRLRRLPSPSSPREKMRLPVFSVALGAILLSAAPQAQQARLSQAPRVLFAVSDVVKNNDGEHVQIEMTVTYDPVAGEYVHETRDAQGRTLTRTTRPTSVAAPTQTEAAVSRRLIETHPEIAALIAQADGDVIIDGGFPLVREDGHACGPGGRCATYDVFVTGPDGGQRLRYVIVDLRQVRILDADADADLDSNLAHPDARRQSRRQF